MQVGPPCRQTHRKLKHTITRRVKRVGPAICDSDRRREFSREARSAAQNLDINAEGAGDAEKFQRCPRTRALGNKGWFACAALPPKPAVLCFSASSAPSAVIFYAAAALFWIELPPRVEAVEVQDRVEHHDVAADGLAAIDRVVGEEHDVALPHRDIHDHRPLRDVGAAIEQT